MARFVYWDNDSSDQTVTESIKVGSVQMDNVTTVIDDGMLRKSLQYPNGRTLTFAYDALDRLDTITDGGTTLGDYDYKGYYLQDRKLNADALRLTYKNSTDLDGYDAFGRTIWMRHYDVSGPTDVVKLAYAYDYASNPTHQDDQVNANVDEAYSYDSLHRLTDYKRGTLSGGSIASPVFEQDWTLDKLGNWSELDDNGTDDVRQHNEVNEICVPCGGEGQIRTYGGTSRCAFPIVRFLLNRKWGHAAFPSATRIHLESRWKTTEGNEKVACPHF